jgi:hypothetical protein
VKNIHLIPTDKPSRLFIAENDIEMFILSDKYELGNKLCQNQNIYITNLEKIEDGEYGLNKFDEIVKYLNGYGYNNYKKIILTTDQDLIKDGVQAIDDTFLEWFVKNPSCEYIEWSSEKIEGSFDGENWKYKYGTVIPKEEPKPFKDMQQLTEVDWEKFKKKPFPSKKEEPKTDYTSKHIEYCHNIAMESLQKELEQDRRVQQMEDRIMGRNVDTGYRLQEVPKEETLEEVAKKQWGNVHRTSVLGFIEGAKWQQEQDKNKYSEKEVWELVNKLNETLNIGSDLTLEQWFENYKKK